MQRVLVAWSLTLLACGRVIAIETDGGDAGSPDSSSDAVFDVSADAGNGGESGDASAAFVCSIGDSSVTCDPHTQYCVIIRSGVGNWVECDIPDGGGVPTCAGASKIAATRGECGCYQDPDSGDVTFVMCAP